MQTPAHSKGNSDERGRVERIDSALFVDIAENKTNSLEKIMIL